MSKKIKAISLFTGAGGMDIGFERVGVEIVFANEIVKEAAETYSTNHPDREVVNDDINNVMARIDEFKGIDLVFGGPQCQGFSVAGKMNPDDERSKLIFTFLDVVEKVKPKAFVMENVKALGILEKWEPIRQKYLDRTNSLGYNCAPFILNATEYGVSQKRERVFFVGIRDNFDPFFEHDIRELIEKQKNLAPTIRELLSPLGRAGTEENPDTCTAKITFATHPIMRKSPYAGMYFNGHGRPINIDGYANTLAALMLIVDKEADNKQYTRTAAPRYSVNVQGQLKKDEQSIVLTLRNNLTCGICVIRNFSCQYILIMPDLFFHVRN